MIFTNTLYRLCKFPNFSVDSRISKIFYISLFFICLVRTGSFGTATGLYADVYESKVQDANGHQHTHNATEDYYLIP